MKCKNCYANYSSRELYCPYCGTDNPRGRLWKRRIDQAESELKTTEAETKPIIDRYVTNRILNRILLIEAAIVLLFIVSVFAIIGFHSGGLSLLNRMSQDAIERDLEAMYAEERFGEMHVYLQEKELFGEEYYEYCQMALLHNDYEYFCSNRLRFFREAEAGELSEYLPRTIVGDIHDVLECYIPAYPELTDRNRVIWERYCRDAEVFSTAVLGFTEAEMELLRQDYLTSGDEAVLVEAILEGRCIDVD